MPAGLDGNPNPVVSAARTRLLELVAIDVTNVDVDGAVLVGIDGASGTGKSTFADELARMLTDAGKTTVRASIDSFHRPRAHRYRLGSDSAEGYYRDSHDLPALREHLLEPFVRGSGTFRRAVFDEPSDHPLHEPSEPVPAIAVLIFDGLFLHRAELARFWNLTVFLVAEERREAAWTEYLSRDLPDDSAMRQAEIARRVTRARRARYLEGQALYERKASPLACANFVIDNDDLENPKLVVARRLG